jgi:hypothetical protein
LFHRKIFSAPEDAIHSHEILFFFQEKQHHRKWFSKTYSLFYGCQAWLLLGLVGLLIAVATLIVVQSVQFFITLKQGYCLDGFLLSSQSCCQGFAVHDPLGKT